MTVILRNFNLTRRSQSPISSSSSTTHVGLHYYIGQLLTTSTALQLWMLRGIVSVSVRVSLSLPLCVCACGRPARLAAVTWHNLECLVLLEATELVISRSRMTWCDMTSVDLTLFSRQHSRRRLAASICQSFVHQVQIAMLSHRCRYTWERFVSGELSRYRWLKADRHHSWMSVDSNSRWWKRKACRLTAVALMRWLCRWNSTRCCDVIRCRYIYVRSLWHTRDTPGVPQTNTMAIALTALACNACNAVAVLACTAPCSGGSKCTLTSTTAP